jgi:NitT/TauT family transport system substrate-binding protein
VRGGTVLKYDFRRLKGFTPIAILLVVILATLGSLSCSQGDYSSRDQRLTIGSTHNEADTLIYIAYEQNFFVANGLNVTIKDYSSGSAAVQGMLKGEVDIATSTEFVIVQNAFKQQTVRTIGTICRSYSEYLIGRTDRGIRDVSDLEGKKVGIPAQTAAQFSFGRFLDLNGMGRKQMTIVNIDIAQSEDVIVNGDVDAVISWEPYVSTIKKKLGDKLVIWPAQSGQPLYKNVTASNVWLAQHPDLVKRVLRSLAQAESFMVFHPDQAKTIVRKRLQYKDEYIASVWPSNQSFLSLDQSLIVAMEDEARWMIKNNLTSGKTVPDFTNYIYLDGLKAVKPEAVNIIR